MKLTELGYPVISDDIHRKIFGSESPKEMSYSERNRAESLLGRFGINVPVDYPENLYDGPLPLPDLRAENLYEHFNKVAADQIGRYKELGDHLSKCELPKAPTVKDFIYQPGWTRYEWDPDCNKFATKTVPYPLEEAFTFDTETFVHEGAYPIIGTAVSDKACYIWLASELIDFTLDRKEWDQFKMIPVGKGRFIAGHNISYDRVRTQEAYSLENTEPENFFFDTLSAHVGVSGLASGQRWLFTIADKEPELLSDSEKSVLRSSPKWLNEGTTNSLVKCYNFHVCQNEFFNDCEPMEMGEKKIREIFVVSEYLSEIAAEMDKVVDYAMKDAVYTARLFQSLWREYLLSTPSMVALCGHFHLNGSVVPLVDNWEEWIQNAERVYQEHNDEMTVLCRDLMKKTYKEWRAIVDSYEDVKEGLKKANEWVNQDPWNSQLDWHVKTFKGKYAKVPNWVRPYVKNPEAPIGVKTRLAHLLLKLKWEGKPVVWVEGSGWCIQDDD